MPRALRPKSLKFHAMAIAAICAVIVILYAIMKPEPVATADPNAPVGDYYVRIVDATWGQNCNTEIQYLRQRGPLPAANSEAEPLPEPVKPNNVLQAVTDYCGKGVTCSLLADGSVLQTEPLASCYKELTVGYRCFSVDRKWSRTVEQGQTLVIDCHPEIDQSKPPESEGGTQ